MKRREDCKTDEPFLAASSASDDKGDLKKYIQDDQMIKILERKGIKKLFPIQYETFALISKGEDVIAKDRTGSGKTLAFALPLVLKLRQQGKFKGIHSPKLLIVLPTRELAIQVKDEIASLKLRDQEDFSIAAIYGGSMMREQLEIVAKGIDIVVATPGRLIDFLKRGAIKLNDLDSICLDEADEMLKIGFKEDIQSIFEFITKAKQTKIQCLLFSATIPQWIEEMSQKYQSKSKKFVDMIKDSNVKTSKTVEHYCFPATNMQKQAYIGPIMKYFLKGKLGKVIIFCETKREVERIFSSNMIPLSTEMLHGDVKQFMREKVFRMFKSGEVNCLVATNVAARGLDFPAIDLIIQMQPPNTTDAYIHRSGRTGRAGKSGVCVTMFSYKEEDAMKRIQRQAKIVMQHLNNNELKEANQRIPNSNSDNRGSNRQSNKDRDSYRDQSRDYRENRDNRDRRDDRERDNRDNRDHRDYRDNRDQSQDNRDNRGQPRDYKDNRDQPRFRQYDKLDRQTELNSNKDYRASKKPDLDLDY